jgi:hypothetical protein
VTREATWICDTCGTEYTADVGKCGQLQPPCDGTVRPATALDWLRKMRDAAAAASPNQEGGQLQVSACCQALYLEWASSERDLESTCTACGKQCYQADFDALAPSPAAGDAA